MLARTPLHLLSALLILSSGALAPADEPKKQVATGTVSGKVTYKGQPLPFGLVTFHPEKGKKVFSGKLHADGTYEVKDVPVGKARVTIEVKAEKGKAKGPAPRVAIPAKYANSKTSGLTVEVKKGKQTHDVNLN
jgi:hypothetical protein